MKIITLFSRSTRSFNKCVRASAALACKSWLILVCAFFLGAANGWAQDSDDWRYTWAFTVLPDGTAALGYPKYETGGGDVYPNWNNPRIVTNLTFPATVTEGAWYNSYETGWKWVYRTGKTYQVTAIAGGFSAEQKAAFQSVEIPSFITTISNWAFLGCTNLREITIPATVTSIGYRVFESCTSLTKATVLNNTIEWLQFSGCAALQDVTLSNNLTTIKQEAFMSCRSMATIEIPASVTDWSSGAFSKCTGLQSITIKAKKIPAFGILPLVSVTMEGVEEIGGNAFTYCNQLTDINFGNSLITIADYAFMCCTALQELTIPATVTSIGRMTFRDCSALKNSC